ncbi:hypothetical protein EGW08_003921 [Elysia chlorotica]|uniref:Hexosyltransferase n=1 Tax=Elysia chlorotica TaxID=188477 RepID=A0A433U3I8_ELYCH|nr:hypothetical protein EGW08_003921 [Elysia chlorotica]
MTNPDFIFNSSQSYFRLRKSKLNALSEALHIPGDHICTVGGQPCVLFVVPSVADYYNAETRVVIRKTWASQFYGKNWLQTSNQRIAFFFGSLGLSAEMRKMLEIESKKYGDIVVAEYNDSYENLSYKMVKIISWVNVFCQGLEIMVKVDMDTFVNVDLLLTLAQTIPAETHPIYVFGHKHELKYPTVVRLGKWAVPEAVYHFHHFPEYIYGHSYVISGPAVKLLAESFPYFPIIPNEDVFITGVMSVVLNITRFHHTSFAHPRERRKWSSIMQNLYVTAIVNDEFRLKFFELFQARRVSKIRCKTLKCIFHYSL